MASSYHIRPATVDDIKTLLDLITELAVYEKSPELVKATPELMRKNIFEKGYAQALLAFEGTLENPGQALGVALYFFNYSTWTGKPGLYLEDLYVSEASRGKGLGTAFFAELGKIAQEKGCGRVDWQVLKWNTPSIEFYEKSIQAKPMEEWLGMRLEGDEQIAKLSTLGKRS
ncbi:acyl-CoA N-acyltransferase [Flagelloscypha sp. PMI_526]|nr:acyl-CoA N-acyltransferase [Flagelloscypha sp. PMI_526]